MLPREMRYTAQKWSKANWQRLPRVLANGQPRVLALGLHPHLIAVPHRIGYLHKMLDLLLARDDVVFVQGRQIADWFGSVSAAA